MAKHPTSSRVHRDPDSPDDAFIGAIKRTVEWTRAHDRQLIIGGVVLAALVLIGVYYVSSQRRVEAEATARLAQVQQSVASGNPQLAIRDLQTYIQTFGGARAAQPARILLADLLLDQDRHAEAVEALGDLPGDLDEPFGVAAARVLAAAREEMGDAEEAVSLYRGIARNARFPFEEREALAEAARVRLQSGDAEGAADLYEDVVESFDDERDAAARGYYAMWLAEARARAATGGPAAPTIPDTAQAPAEAAEEG